MWILGVFHPTPRHPILCFIAQGGVYISTHHGRAQKQQIILSPSRRGIGAPPGTCKGQRGVYLVHRRYSSTVAYCSGSTTTVLTAFLSCVGPPSSGSEAKGGAVCGGPGQEGGGSGRHDKT